jgi:hypothetical protein
VLLSAAPVCAAERSAVSLADLQAASRSLGFLDTLRRDGPIVVGIVYAPATANAQALAAETADRLRSISGPNAAPFRPELIPASELPQFAGRLDAVFLMPGSSGETIADAIRRRRIVSISSDPACLDARCCVLHVRTASGVEIVLDTALANAVGARFSPVFAMMVKRR